MAGARVADDCTLLPEALGVRSAAQVAEDASCRLVPRPCGGAWAIPLLGRFPVVVRDHRRRRPVHPGREPGKGPALSEPTESEQPPSRPARRRRLGLVIGVLAVAVSAVVAMAILIGNFRSVSQSAPPSRRALVTRSRPSSHGHANVLRHCYAGATRALPAGKPQSAGWPFRRQSRLRRESLLRGSTDI